MAVTQDFYDKQALIAVENLSMDPKNEFFSHNPFISIILNECAKNGRLENGYGAMIQRNIDFGGSLFQATDSNGIPDGDTSMETKTVTNAAVAIGDWKTYARKAEWEKKQINTVIQTGNVNKYYDIIKQGVNKEIANGYNTLEYDIQGDSTGNNGLAIEGIQSIINTDITAPLHGIDPANYPKWHASVYDLSTDPNLASFGTTYTEDNILLLLNYVINGSGRNNKGSIDYIFCNSAEYNLIATAMINKQYTTNTDRSMYGFNVLDFRGVQIINLGGLKLDDGSVTASGIPEGYIYFINSSTFWTYYNNPYESKTVKLKEVMNEDEDIEGAWGIDRVPNLFYILPKDDFQDYKMGFLSDDPNSLKAYAKIVAELNILCDDRLSNAVLYMSGDTPVTAETAEDIPMSDTDPTTVNEAITSLQTTVATKADQTALDALSTTVDDLTGEDIPMSDSDATTVTDAITALTPPALESQQSKKGK